MGRPPLGRQGAGDRARTQTQAAQVTVSCHVTSCGFWCEGQDVSWSLPPHEGLWWWVCPEEWMEEGTEPGLYCTRAEGHADCPGPELTTAERSRDGVQSSAPAPLSPALLPALSLARPLGTPTTGSVSSAEAGIESLLVVSCETGCTHWALPPPCTHGPPCQAQVLTLLLPSKARDPGFGSVQRLSDSTQGPERGISSSAGFL